MNDVLLKLREQLISMIDVIDNYIPSQEDVIFINKEDMKHLKWVKKSDFDRNLFEYKKTIKFTLTTNSHGSWDYQRLVYNQIMKGSIEKIVLVRLTTETHIETHMGDIPINYKLEEWEQTKLRDLYNNESK